METPIHPLWLRIPHWLNAFAVLILVTSGWRIYNASPLFEFRIPKDIALGGWLGGALQWHFAAMWLLAANGLIYVVMNIATGRLRAKRLPVRIRALIADMKAALSGKLVHADQTGLQEPQAHQRDFCDQRLSRRLLGESGLQLVRRFVS